MRHDPSDRRAALYGLTPGWESLSLGGKPSLDFGASGLEAQKLNAAMPASGLLRPAQPFVFKPATAEDLARMQSIAREAMEAGFDILIAAAFNFDAHASEFDRMGGMGGAIGGAENLAGHGNASLMMLILAQTMAASRPGRLDLHQNLFTQGQERCDENSSCRLHGGT